MAISGNMGFHLPPYDWQGRKPLFIFTMARENKEYKQVRVRADTHKYLTKARDHFQKKIGGGKWSLGDAVDELIKIAESTRH